MKRRKINIVAMILINIVLLLFSALIYRYIFKIELMRKTYAAESVEFVEGNENPVFKIGQIILYNSASAIDNSEGQLKDVDISQFTDIAIYIDNKGKNEEIEPENTINEMYIDNIKIEPASDMGESIFNYKNPQFGGKYVELSNWQEDGILFNIINTNEENKTADYNIPTFFTDCSNPITLGLIHKNILSNCEVSTDHGTITFDGSILKNSNIDLDKLKTKISFSINITNNYNEKFVCNVEIENDLSSESDDGIYSGYLVKMITPETDEYNFIKVAK